jgi:uracil-DNA glycosylase
MQRFRQCTICADLQINSALYDGNLQLGARPFKGKSPWVLLIGQDPTVRRRQIACVLDLENRGGALYKYIVGDILEPVGLDLDDVYATDLVKCLFPHNQTPTSIARKHGMAAKDFLYPFFEHCKQHLIQEIQEIRPKIAISFGQPTHQLLCESFGWTLPTGMKDAFGSYGHVSVAGCEMIYFPCIHINSRGHQYYQGLWNVFIDNLVQVVDEVRTEE